MENNTLTFKQQILWNDPRLKLLKERLDLIPLQSPEVRTSIAITNRIDEFFRDFKDPAYLSKPQLVKYQAPDGTWHESPF